MPVSVTMPALGESVTEGTVTRWLKKEGDHVEVDEPLLEVSTDKVDTEIPSPVAGVLRIDQGRRGRDRRRRRELAVIGDATPGQRRSRRPEAPSPPPSRARPLLPEPPKPEAAGSPPPRTPHPPPRPPRLGRLRRPRCKMPALGESVTEGTVTRWLKQVGDTVAVDEPLLEVSTDKVDTEIPSPAAGVLLEITSARTRPSRSAPRSPDRRPPGSVPGRRPAPAPSRQAPAAPAAGVPLPPRPPRPGGQLARRPAPVGRSGDPRRSRRLRLPSGAQAPSAESRRRPRRPGRSTTTVPPVRHPAGAQARRRARRRPGRVTGTGVGGRIRKQDVLDAAENAQAKQPPGRARGRRRAPAAAPAPRSRSPHPTPAARPHREAVPAAQGDRQRMVESLQVSAQLTTVVEVDVTAHRRLRERAKAASRPARASSSPSCRSSRWRRSRR
jgi:pyruvate dehydrogenase E2 component (dihydrolipoamide acetyltransferase)